PCLSRSFLTPAQRFVSNFGSAFSPVSSWMSMCRRSFFAAHSMASSSFRRRLMSTPMRSRSFTCAPYEKSLVTQFWSSVLCRRLFPGICGIAAREVFHRRRDPAFSVRDTAELESHLDAAEGAAQHKVVEVAQVADAEHLVAQLREPG